MNRLQEIMDQNTSHKLTPLLKAAILSSLKRQQKKLDRRISLKITITKNSLSDKETKKKNWAA